MRKIIFYTLIGFLLIVSITAVSINPLLINQDKVKSFMVGKMNDTNPELTSANFTVKSIIIDNNLTIIKVNQDGKPKTLIISNEKVLEKLI